MSAYVPIFYIDQALLGAEIKTGNKDNSFGIQLTQGDFALEHFRGDQIGQAEYDYYDGEADCYFHISI